MSLSLRLCVLGWLAAWPVVALSLVSVPLGVDLQGGVALVLEVEREALIAGEVDADAAYLGARAATDLPGAVVRVSAWDELAVEGGGAPPEQVARFVAEHLDVYRPAGGDGAVRRFRLSDTWQRRLEARAMERTVERLRRAAGCVAGPVGDLRVAVALPGVTEPSRCP